MAGHFGFLLLYVTVFRPIRDILSEILHINLTLSTCFDSITYYWKNSNMADLQPYLILRTWCKSNMLVVCAFRY